jgi:Icc-related predicted phosphoesterase
MTIPAAYPSYPCGTRNAMNILAIGDPHGHLEKVKGMPHADAIILTGDFGDASLARTMAFTSIHRRHKGLLPLKYTAKQRKRAFMQQYTTGLRLVKYLAKWAPVYLIYGNAEHTDAQTRWRSKRIGLVLPSITKALKAIPNVHIINGKQVKLGSLRVGGIGCFRDDDKQEAQKAKQTLRRFTKLDILVCHQPPYRYLDKVHQPWLPIQGKHVGSKTIASYIRTRKPALVLCGHVHEAKGMAKIGKTVVYNLGECNYKLFKLNPAQHSGK